MLKVLGSGHIYERYWQTWMVIWFHTTINEVRQRAGCRGCGMSPDAPAKALARFLTERGVQTPSGRSTVWQATTVQRLKARW